MSSLGGVTGINTAADSPNIAIAGEVTVYTKSFSTKYSAYFGIWYKAASASGTPTLKVELEQSYKRPTTEGAADGDWVVAESASDIESNLNDELAHVATLAPSPMPYGRLKITGLTSNPEDAILVAKLFSQGNA